MDRRKFLGMIGLGASQKFSLPNFASALRIFSSAGSGAPQGKQFKAYGSGHFGEWITDRFGLPAYRYTCDQLTDPKALVPVHKECALPPIIPTR